MNGLSPTTSAKAARRRTVRARAFTLFEVVIGLVVLSLFVGSVFTIIQTTLRATVEVESLQREHDRQRQTIDFMREMFGALPPGTSLRLRIIEPGDPPLQQLDIRGAPNAFPFGGQGSSVNPTLLALRPSGEVDSNSGEPLHDLCVSRADLLGPEDQESGELLAGSSRTLAMDEEGRPWLSILRDVRALRWTFYRASRREWSDDWRRNSLPNLVRMEIWMGGREHPLTAVYDLPRPGDAAEVPDAEDDEVDGQMAVDRVTGEPLEESAGPAMPGRVRDGGGTEPAGEESAAGEDSGGGRGPEVDAR